MSEKGNPHSARPFPFVLLFSRATVMTTIRRSVLLALLATLGFGLAACENTIRGVGRDVQETGEAVEDTAEGNP